MSANATQTQVVELAYDAAERELREGFPFVLRDAPIASIARRAAGGAMSKLLTEALAQITACAVPGENVPGVSGSIGPEGELYNEAVGACHDVISELLKALNMPQTAAPETPAVEEGPEVGGSARVRVILKLDLDPLAAAAGAEFVINETIQGLIGTEVFSSPKGWGEITQVEVEACALTRNGPS